MKELIEKLLKERRKTKAELATILKITYPGLQNKLINDTFKHNEILQLEEFFEVERGYFNSEPKVEAKTQPSIWEVAKEQYDARVKELTQALEDARYTIQLQRKMLEQNSFKFVSKKPPVKVVNFSFMYVSHISPTPVLNIG